jgi:energy-coupling factor transporter ATP-binding protein EcfA2
MLHRPPRAEPRAEPWFDRLRLTQVRCFEDVLIPLDRRVTVILGENGSGKTTIAEALASLSFGDREGLPAFPLRRGARTGEIALYEPGAEAPAASWSSSDAPRRLPESRYVFAYGRYRRVQYQGPAAAGFPRELLVTDLSALVQRRRTTTLFAPDNHVLELGPAIIQLDGLRGENVDAQAAWDMIQAAVRALGHGLTGVRVLERDGQDVAVVQRGRVDLPLRELSDGYQAILVIVLDLAIRYAFLSPLPDPARRPATVVIDEVDLHLHPRWQTRVVRQLAGLFPETQFILTTHSAAVVQGAVDDGHTVLALGEAGGKATVTPLSAAARRSLRGAQLGSVLVDRNLLGADTTLHRCRAHFC